MKMQPRISFSVDSLLGRKTSEADIKPFTDLEDLGNTKLGDTNENSATETDRNNDNDHYDSSRVKEELSESEGELNVEDEYDDEDESPRRSPASPFSPASHPLMPTPLLGRAAFPSGLPGLLRPPWAQNPMQLQMAAGLNPAFFNKGIREKYIELIFVHSSLYSLSN